MDYFALTAEGAATQSRALTFLKVSGKDPSTASVVYELGFPPLEPPSFNLHKVSPADACLDYAWIDRSGATLQTGTLCDPEKCVRASYTTWMEMEFCFSYYIDPTIWEGLPPNSCEDPPVLPTAEVPDAGIVDVEGPGDGTIEMEGTPDAGPDGRPTTNESKGLCSVQFAAPSTSLLSGGWLALLAAALWRTRTRVTAHGRSGGRPSRSSH
ncbi:MAG: hypothetical protein QM778_20985 [Myxococcales bacterium]